jgi:hypothetical protein
MISWPSYWGLWWYKMVEGLGDAKLLTSWPGSKRSKDKEAGVSNPL